MSGFSDTMKSADKVDISLGPVQQESKQPTYTVKCSYNNEYPLILCGLSHAMACEYLELEIKRFATKPYHRLKITIKKEIT